MVFKRVCACTIGPQVSAFCTAVFCFSTGIYPGIPHPLSVIEFAGKFFASVFHIKTGSVKAKYEMQPFKSISQPVENIAEVQELAGICNKPFTVPVTQS